MANKSILILVDGMRPDALPVCGNRYCSEILSTGAVQLPGRSVMPSVTLPCHISLFHSVPPTRHGTLTNTYAQQVRPVKSLFEVLNNAGKTCAMFYNWEQLRDISLPGNKSFDLYMSLHNFADTDRKLTDAAIAHIAAEKPDCVFLYLGETDEAGHAEGWLGEFYLKTLSNAWDCIRRVAEATAGEYDLIVTADHGGHDRMHGTDMPEDMDIPVFVRTADGTPLREGVTATGLLDIAPTVCARLGVAADRDWEGVSLV